MRSRTRKGVFWFINWFKTYLIFADSRRDLRFFFHAGLVNWICQSRKFQIVLFCFTAASAVNWLLLLPEKLPVMQTDSTVFLSLISVSLSEHSNFSGLVSGVFNIFPSSHRCTYLIHFTLNNKTSCAEEYKLLCVILLAVFSLCLG